MVIRNTYDKSYKNGCMLLYDLFINEISANENVTG